MRFGEKIWGGGMFLLSRRGSISKGGYVSSFERGEGGALAWGVHWHGGAVVGGVFAQRKVRPDI